MSVVLGKKKPHALSSASSEILEENPICQRLIASVLSQRVSHWFDMGTKQHMWGLQDGCWLVLCFSEMHNHQPSSFAGASEFSCCRISDYSFRLKGTSYV